VLARYSAETGREAVRVPAHSLWDREDWATASPDALDDGEIVEAKTAIHHEDWGEPCTIERWTPAAAEVVRADYYLQVAHQLWVCDAPRAHLAVLLPRRGADPFGLLDERLDLRVYHIERDREVEAALVERLRGWWRRHVVAGEPLDLDGSPAAGRYLARLPASGTARATEQQVALAAAYEVARRQEDEWSAARKRISQELVASAGSASRLDLPVGRVALVRHPGHPTLDERSLLADHPELGEVLDQYRRPGSPYVYPRVSGVEAR
jgi:hypothetical protein